MASDQSTGNEKSIEDNENEGNHLATVRELWRYLWPKGRTDLKVRVVLAMSFLVAAKILGVYVPFILADAVDILAGDKEITTEIIIGAIPVGLIVGYGLARVLSQAFGEIRDAIFVKVGQHALRNIALNTFRHLHLLSLRFHLERRTGGLSRVIERATRGIDFLLRFMLFNILPTILEIGIISSIFWVKFGFLYALITFVCLSSYIYFTIAVTEWRLKFRREMNKQDTKANGRAIDSLINFETVKYFTSEHHEAERYDKSLKNYQQAAIKSQISLTLLNVGQGFIISGGLVAVLLMGAQGVAEGRFTIGEFVLINSLLIQIYIPLNFLGFVYREIKQSLVDMEKMFMLIAKHPEIQDKADAEPIDINKGTIEFNDVNFHYSEDRPILKGVSFKVEGGTTTAIVGSSGAGKSTISRILFRFYDIASGSVTVDGQDVRDVQQLSLRNEIGVVPQDTVLFNDSIKYNIAYGRHNATDEEVVEAAKLAKIHDFIMTLPDGYETEVGERGLKLSGGEKQRVAIARTILKNPSILLLDEATSALDSHTERDIQQSLEQISEQRTAIVIAHRLSTIINVNEILVLDGGQIVERGKHTELLDKNGKYAQMWQKQQQLDEAQQRLIELKKNDEKLA
ncbi:ABCB family ABC transporter ATP-binding protein/permease [Pseudemcibacter aquimaris]|uniref:ABCB family ABC transporter ATP-binding protein/permease n=1 Tax=Pseudemcibacter aquimaris TaxID=2857064 RepID=UPI002012D4FB|nr:ABC transporter ATP-binding protein/permease [Pseudemcibacter aquimaris]MCC3860839.1 ABC transporter ATP-binding protein/permease [Pseudemcibacter aquimaris]WDU59658.1 ABC transporter ATP-binding protein/permease [Pseudemcibacter aquimaris]